YQGDFFSNFKQFLAERISYVPKLTKRLVVDKVGLPHWLDYEEFDLDYHVRRTHVRSEDDKAIFRKIGRIQHKHFDMDKPLFMFYVIEGLKDGRIALVQKFHHAFADGKTAVRVMDLFSDEGLERARRDEDLAEHESPGLLKRSLSGCVEDLRRTVVSLPGITGAARRMVGEGGQEMLNRLQSRPVTIFNQPLSQRRLFAFKHWPLKEMTAVRKAAGLTFNDLGLVLLSGALKRYMDELDVLPDESLVCNVPVALNVPGSSSGNAVLAMWVPLGTHLEDREQRIQFIKKEADSCKTFLSGVVEGAASGQGIQLPSYVVKLMGMQLSSEWLTRRMPPPGNVGMSNVASQAQTIHVAGAKVESLFGLPMLLQGQAVSTTFSSYDDKVVSSILCCEQALPDPERIFEYMQDEFKALHNIYLKPARERGAGNQPRRKTGRKVAKKTTVAA
ncbi:MAG: wax ester/triacylglycerol synthase domain-containing protein, partial [Pseudomonadales bacterium]